MPIGPAWALFLTLPNRWTILLTYPIMMSYLVDRHTRYENGQTEENIRYVDAPVERLFDMKNDPGETRNLASDSHYGAALAAHRRLLGQHEAVLDVLGDIPHAEFWRERG